MPHMPPELDDRHVSTLATPGHKLEIIRLFCLYYEKNCKHRVGGPFFKSLPSFFQIIVSEPMMDDFRDWWLMEPIPNVPINKYLSLINTDCVWIISKAKGLSINEQEHKALQNEKMDYHLSLAFTLFIHSGYRCHYWWEMCSVP